MIFTRDFVTRENQWQITPLVTQKSLFTVTHALFFISQSVVAICDFRAEIGIRLIEESNLGTVFKVVHFAINVRRELPIIICSVTALCMPLLKLCSGNYYISHPGCFIGKQCYGWPLLRPTYQSLSMRLPGLEWRWHTIDSVKPAKVGYFIFVTISKDFSTLWLQWISHHGSLSTQ